MENQNAPPLPGPAADSRLGELLIDVLPLACASGFALDLQQARFLCGATFREGARRADGSLDTRGFKGGAADMITSSLRLQAPWLRAARAAHDPWLLRAAARGDARRVRELVAAGAPLGTTRGGRCALHVAALTGGAAVARILLEGKFEACGADPNARDNDSGATPLMCAAGARPDDAAHGEGLPPGDYAGVVRLLLAHGADVRLGTWGSPRGARTALHYAVGDRASGVYRRLAPARLDAIALLCAAPGAREALAMRSPKGLTPLAFALEIGAEEAAEALRRGGALE